MVFSESTDTFLADFGVPVVAGAVSGLGILDSPDQQVGQWAVSTEYSVLVLVSLFAAVQKGDAVTVNGVSYVAREEIRKESDGVFGRLILNKV